MEKLNIAEILKDCPSGMELDCTMYENCTFDGIENVGYINILVKTPNGQIKLSKEGCYIHNCSSAKCIIFPKGKTTWEGFQRPFKDGDVVTDIEGAIIIYKGITTSGYCGSFVSLDRNNQFIPHCISYLNYIRFATEEEKQKLFKAINDNGYKWDPETKTLEKLVEPKFKVGDKIINKKGNIRLISKIMDDEYHFESGGFILFRDHDYWELVPNKFDITTLKPFESRVLVRSCNDDIWKPAIWGIYNDIYNSNYPYITTYGATCQCIPFEGNEHLLGTTNDCDDYYKTWE